MELLACGFNAHSQLKNDPADGSAPKDLFVLSRIAKGDDIKILFAGWSCIIYLLNNDLHIKGYIETSPPHKSPATIKLPISSIKTSAQIQSIFGGPSGASGLLTIAGLQHTFMHKASGLTLSPTGDENSPTLSHIARTNTTHTSIIFLQAPGSSMIHILTFQFYTQFINWYRNPSSSNPDSYIHHMLSGHAKSLKASATSFALLTREGEVYTWGDPRYSRTLARTPTTEFPAHTPALVEVLGGIPVEKIDTGGGWMFGALSKEADLYLWGSGKPGSNSNSSNHEEVDDMLGAGDEEIKLVDIEGVESIKDFGVGNGHVAILSKNGDVWVRGENCNGQLGLGLEAGNFVGEWTKVELRKDGEEKAKPKVAKVDVGDLCTFLTVAPEEICSEDIFN